MAEVNGFTIKELKGIEGYQFLQVMYFLLRSAYYTPEINTNALPIDKFFKSLGEMTPEEIEPVLTKIAVLGADVSKDYWDIIFKCTQKNANPIIPEAISTFTVDELVYIIREGLKKVLAIKLPF